MRRFLMVMLIVGLVSSSVVLASVITVWDVWTTGTMKPVIDEAAVRFGKWNPGMQINVVHIQNDPFKTKLKIAMGAGTPPDIFQSWGGGVLKAYIDAGKVYPLDKLNTWLKAKFMPSAFDPVTFNGHIYGVPAESVTGAFFWYRKSIFKKYNIQIPKTWSDFLNVCSKLKKNGIIPIALANRTKWPGSFYYMYLADRIAGYEFVQKVLNHEKGYSFVSDPYIQAGKMLQVLVKMGAFEKGFNGLDYDTGQSRALFYTRKSAMILMGSWLYGAIKREAPQIIDDIGIFNFPMIENGKGDPDDLVGSPGQDYLCITNAAKDKRAAMLFLRNYFTDAIALQEAVAGGNLIPFKGVETFVTDPVVSEELNLFMKAKHVQLWYDQFLPPELGEVHKNVVQALFGLQITPEQASEQQQKAFDKYYSK